VLGIGGEGHTFMASHRRPLCGAENLVPIFLIKEVAYLNPSPYLILLEGDLGMYA
jgi:hypothetical protein